jgi:hypothetical protein
MGRECRCCLAILPTGGRKTAQGCDLHIESTCPGGVSMSSLRIDTSAGAQRVS